MVVFWPVCVADGQCNPGNGACVGWWELRGCNSGLVAAAHQQ